MNQAERRRFLIDELLKERGEEIEIPANAEGQQQLLRALMNVRGPEPLAPEVLEVQDAYLQERLSERGVTHVADLAPVDPQDQLLSRIYVWQGDITTLDADAIVNAANNRMLGCFVPGHHCIDNAIHTYAGMQLRAECNELMQKQGIFEPTGRVKVTGAYNLPSHYVFHTIGPIVERETVQPREKILLKSCYVECLREATARGLDNIAFCCISTGVFGYPQSEAGRLAIHTVRDYLSNNDPHLKVVFNVFLDTDLNIYNHVLRRFAQDSKRNRES